MCKLTYPLFGERRKKGIPLCDSSEEISVSVGRSVGGAGRGKTLMDARLRERERDGRFYFATLISAQCGRVGEEEQARLHSVRPSGRPCVCVCVCMCVCVCE